MQCTVDDDDDDDTYCDDDDDDNNNDDDTYCNDDDDDNNNNINDDEIYFVSKTLRCWRIEISIHHNILIDLYSIISEYTHLLYSSVLHSSILYYNVLAIISTLLFYTNLLNCVVNTVLCHCHY